MQVDQKNKIFLDVKHNKWNDFVFSIFFEKLLTEKMKWQSNRWCDKGHMVEKP